MCSDLMWSDPVEEKTFEDWQVYDLNRYRKIDFDSNPGRNLCVLFTHTHLRAHTDPYHLHIHIYTRTHTDPYQPTDAPPMNTIPH